MVAAARVSFSRKCAVAHACVGVFGARRTQVTVLVEFRTGPITAKLNVLS